MQKARRSLIGGYSGGVEDWGDDYKELPFESLALQGGVDPKKVKENGDKIKVRVMNPVKFVEEVLGIE